MDNCAQIAESGLKPPFESPHLDFPEFPGNCFHNYFLSEGADIERVSPEDRMCRCPPAMWRIAGPASEALARSSVTAMAISKDHLLTVQKLDV